MSPVAPFTPSTMSSRPSRPVQSEPLYFGPDGSLFGVFHPAARVRPRPGAILLCLPIGHEYFRVHRAFRNIAVALSRVGFSVLRFDYYGTGDSHGDSSTATIARWQADIASAIEELKRRSGTPRVSIVGLRFGAALAWLACLTRTDVDILTMWEPVVSGSAYFDRLRQLEQEWLTDPSRRAPADAERKENCVLGMRLGRDLEAQIRAVDIAAGPLPATAHVVTLMPAPDSPVEPRWRERLVERYGANSYASLATGADWADPATVHTAAYAAAGVQGLPAMFDRVLV
ncbi:MAG TPA: alpha/beta hydrolase [Vicinamibacterales bacterium]|nr:alpha/beta hydrolase [Vicinamibacterales bacterium]